MVCFPTSVASILVGLITIQGNFVTTFSQCLRPSVGKFETSFAFQKILSHHFQLLFRIYLFMATLWTVNAWFNHGLTVSEQKTQPMHVMPCCKENNFSNPNLMWPVYRSGTVGLVLLLSDKCVIICSTIALGDKIPPAPACCLYLTMFNNITQLPVNQTSVKSICPLKNQQWSSLALSR